MIHVKVSGSGSNICIRCNFNGRGIGIYKADYTGYHEASCIELVISTSGSQAKEFSFDFGIPPSRPSKPRLYGDSETVHHNLRGELVVGGQIEHFINLPFGTADFTVDRSTFESPMLGYGLVLRPGDVFIWEPQFVAEWGSSMIVCREVELNSSSKYRYFWYRYPPSSPWSRNDFVGLVVSRDWSSYGIAAYAANQSPPNNDPEWTPSGFVDALLQGVPDSTLAPDGWYVASKQVASTPVSSKAYLRSYWKRALRAACHRLSDAIVYSEEDMAKLERSLGQTACDAFHPVQANTLSTLIELKNLKSEVGGWIEGLQEVGKNFKSPGKFIRALGNLRLSTKWGIPLTVADAREIANQVTDDIVYGITRDNWQSSRARDHLNGYPKRGLIGLNGPVEISVGLKAYVSKYDSRTTKLASGLFDYGLISYSNVWDMIPYSFVVDWFTNVSDRIDLIDSTFYKDAFLDVRGSVLSHCWEVPVPSNTWEMLLGLPIKWASTTYRFYQREILDSIPWPHLEDKELSSNLGFVQFLDGGTLILQRVPG